MKIKVIFEQEKFNGSYLTKRNYPITIDTPYGESDAIEKAVYEYERRHAHLRPSVWDWQTRGFRVKKAAERSRYE